MFNISKQSDYGLLMLEYLKDKKDYISLTEIVEKLKLPKRFLARIASKLVSAKILLSREGKIGGYLLNPEIKSLTLYDYLRVFEGDLALTKCFDKNYQCQWEKNCSHKKFFDNKLRNAFIENLKREKLLKILG
jgi:Rrf2 family protein